jgi:DNA-binding NarL/FixJ family response regulator
VDAYICKPVSFEEVLEKLEHALAARARASNRARRLDQLEGGLNALARQLETLGKQTGLLGSPREITDLPELGRLSTREWDVLDAVLMGYRATDIGCKLSISPFTVRNHIRSIFRKLGVRSQSELLTKLRPVAPG